MGTLLFLIIYSFFFSSPGDLKWRTRIDSTSEYIDFCISNKDDGKLFVPSGMHLISILKTDGEIDWNYSMGNQTIESVCTNSNYVFISGENKTCLALDCSTGQVIWSIDNLITGFSGIVDSFVVIVDQKIEVLNSNSGKKYWEFTLDDIHFRSFCSSSFNIFAITNKSSLLALDVLNKNQKWIFNASEQVYLRPSYSDNTVFFSTDDNCLCAVNASNGELKWKNTYENHKMLTSPCIYNNYIYIGDSYSWLWKIKTTSGEVVWYKDTESIYHSTPQAANGIIYFAGGNTYTKALSAFNGEELWTYHTDNVANMDGIFENGVFYLCDVTTFVYALDASGTGFKGKKSASSLPSPSLSISPNPFSTRLSLSLPSSGAVYSLTGQLIMKLTKGKHSIDTSKWKQGVYIVKSGKETKRIVKIN